MTPKAWLTGNRKYCGGGMDIYIYAFLKRFLSLHIQEDIYIYIKSPLLHLYKNKLRRTITNFDFLDKHLLSCTEKQVVQVNYKYMYNV